MHTKKTKIFAGVVLWLLLGLGISYGAEVRFWHERNGNEFRGEFSKEVFGNIYFRGLDGRVFPVAATNLIDSDWAYIRGLIPPKLQIKFSSKLREKDDYPAEYDSGVWDDHEIEVTGIVEIKKLSKFAYNGTLRGELYLIGEEVATDDYRLFAKKGFTITFPDQKSDLFRYQMMETLRYYSENGMEPRGAHYKGHVVIVETADGERLAFDSNLVWMKEDKIDALRKIPCPGFLDEDCKKRPVPRPFDSRAAGGETY